AALAIVFAATTAAAQSRTLGKADVPFGFTAHNQQLGAGSYTVRQIGRDVLRLEDAQGKGITLIGVAAPASADAALTFHRYGSTYFLAAVNSPVAGAELPRTTEEKRAASRSREMTKIALALR